jgi:patatin-like phospholipase/acyl hydrolase
MASFDANVLATEIQKIIANSGRGTRKDAPLHDVRNDLCRTFVVATRLRATGAVRMRTYRTSTSLPFSAAIWEAARATSAAPTFFVPITINNVEYGDGGTGWNNPTKEAINEAHKIWPHRPVGCVVSLGTGLEDALQLNEESEQLSTVAKTLLQHTSPKNAFRLAVAEYCVKCSTSCEIVHRELSENPQKDILGGNYFRLNVAQGMSKIGLDEWEKLGDIIALTDSYMDLGETVERTQRIARLLRDPQLASQSLI